MEEKSLSLCDVCGTPLVPANQDLELNDKLNLDGSWSFDNMVCPHCHPELVKTE